MGQSSYSAPNSGGGAGGGFWQVVAGVLFPILAYAEQYFVSGMYALGLNTTAGFAGAQYDNGAGVTSTMTVTPTSSGFIYQTAGGIASGVLVSSTKIESSCNDSATGNFSVIGQLPTQIANGVGDGAANSMQTLLSLNGLAVLHNGANVFGINNAGHIETNQFTAAVIAPVATVGFLNVYNTAGVLLGRIPVI